MSWIFADAFFWVALTNTRDQDHEGALAFVRERGFAEIFTTDEVLTEFLNYFAEWGGHVRENAARIAERMRSDSAVLVAPQSRASFDAGLVLYRARSDKGYSLTDCISMVAMRAEGIAEVLTNDTHFEQEGFRALFRERR